MATGRTAASAAATEAESDETKRGRRGGVAFVSFAQMGQLTRKFPQSIRGHFKWAGLYWSCRQGGSSRPKSVLDVLKGCLRVKVWF